MERNLPEQSGLAFHFFIGGVQRADWLTATVLFAVASLALYFGTARWPETPDGLFHLQRVRALSEALRAGVLYPRWFPDFAFEYGHPIFNYYAPAFYYPSALFDRVGLGALTSTRLALALLFGLSGVTMYALLRSWTSTQAALAGAAVYLLFPYRLYDLFIRGALPEFVAFLWLPLLILAVVRLGRRSPVGSQSPPSPTTIRLVSYLAPWRESLLPIVAASIVWAGLIVTHNLTALMAGLAVAAIVLLVGVATRRPASAGRILLQGALSVLLGLLLASWYAVPAIVESSWVGIGSAPISYGYLNHFTDWQTLFDWQLIFAYPSAAESTVPLPGWVALLLLLMLATVPWAQRWSLMLPLLIGLILTLGSIWMTTSSSEWLWTATAPILGKLQFPWRWQSITALGVAMLVGILLEMAQRTISRTRYRRKHEHSDVQVDEYRHRNGKGHGWPAWLLAMTIIGLMVINATADMTYSQADYYDTDITRQQMWNFDTQFGQIGMTWTGEFLPRWVEEQRWAIGQPPSDGSSAVGHPSVQMMVTPLALGYQSATYRINAVEETAVIWHHFYFPSWQVQIDGVPAETIPTSNLGLLSAVVQPGEHTVTVDWHPTAAVRIGRLLTVFGWAIVAIILLILAVHRRWLIGWLTLGIFALIVMISPFERQEKPVQVGADYGAVRLEAATTAPVNNDEILPVRLHWLIIETSPPLTAFIHVVDENGVVVAQNDAPLAGEYTPPARWIPGLTLGHTHTINLPDELAPGTYVLKAGLYEPGKADTPLLPTGQGDPRVTIGLLEVYE